MDQTKLIPPDAFDVRHRFMDRRKLLGKQDQAKALAGEIRGLIERSQNDVLRALISQYYPPDLADVMEFLTDEQDRYVFDLLDPAESADVLDELDDCTRELLMRGTPAERIARIISTLPTDEGAYLLRFLGPVPQAAEDVLALLSPEIAEDIRYLLSFPKESAGGLMSLGYVAVADSATVGEAIQRFKDTPGIESIFGIFVVDGNGLLKGAADFHTMLKVSPDRVITEIMVAGIARVNVTMDQEDAARIFARYDLNTLPVVANEPEGKLVGVITADDIIDVIEQEFTQDILRMAGSDAAEMERTSPVHIALLRLPWIMATMFIELMAGFVIRFYNPTLAKVLLLTSFMPIISAISGNTGLQSATIIVRGLSAGSIRITEWVRAITRQLTMTVILGGVTGLTLGIIGAIWYGKWIFGLVVFLGMFAAVNIAGVVGTVVPLTSKRLGFDPAITSGPFETAFQDVVGISIFLTLATVMLRFLVK